MLDETLKSVKAAEDAAAAKLQAAEDTAGEILEQARTQARELKAATIAKCKTLVQEQETAVNVKGEEARTAARQQLDAEIENMKQAALNREQDAIRAVIDHLG